MKLDRAIQRALLEKLAEHYPNGCFDVLKECEVDRPIGLVNMVYLTEHDLAEAKFNVRSGVLSDFAGRQRITAKGMDFLADDGGLSAILGTVTVKLHQDTIEHLIEKRLTEAEIPPEEKSRLLQTVRELPGESIKHLTTKLLDAGLENVPRLVELIRTALP